MSDFVQGGHRVYAARRTFWLKHLHQWHWISAAVCLAGMFLFAITGITLNHAADIEAKPRVEELRDTLPGPLLDQLKATPAERRTGPVPAAVAAWAVVNLDADIAGRPAEWSKDEIYVALPRPGGDAWLTIALEDGDAVHEHTDRGWISYLNDLHKGRHTGRAWSWFLDIFGGACLVFCATGLFLLQLHAGNRPATWPTVGLGLAAPLVLALLFIH